MNKNIMIISSTPRRGGNSEILVDSFALGAKESGHQVETIYIRDLDLRFCTGCLYCQKHDKCILKDSINEILPKIQKADVLVFATPIYYYEMTGQLKTFLDRMNPLFPKENNFRQVYLLTSAADTEPTAIDGAIRGIQGWIDCFEGVTLKGIVRGIDSSDIGDIVRTNAPQQAYEMGKKIREVF